MPQMSILALYNYDPSIFEGFRVPETLDKDTVVNELCLDLAELSLIYPSPSTMKTAIKIWTDVHYKEWEDLEETLYYEYNPIWNVDGTVVEERDLNSNHTKTGTDTVNASGKDSLQLSGKDSVQLSGKDDVQASGKDTVQLSGTDTVANTGTDTLTNSGTDTTTNYVTGFNSSTETEANKSTLAHGHVETTGYGSSSGTTYGRKDETTYGRKDETTYGRKDETTYGRKDETTYGRQDQTTYNTTDDIDDTGTVTTTRQGNIGVTMTQQLIQAQRDIVQFNVTDFIIRQFKRKFCVMVY